MADEAQYASPTDSSLGSKRKYEDETAPSGPRRPTGFSAPVASQSPDSANAPSYNSVPPPVDDIQLAKQRAQEIAARLFNSAEAKRPRVDNGATGFDSADNAGQKPLLSSVTPSSMPAAYGYQGTSKRIEIPNGRVGVIIGKAGETIKYLQHQSGAKIQVTRDMDADPNSPTRTVELMGTPDQITKAEQLIQDVLSEAEAGGSGTVTRRLSGQQYGAEHFEMKIPNNKVGLVIGKGGETIKNMQASSGARIQVIPLHLPPGDTSMERTVHIDGTSEQIEAAKQLVNEVTSENRARNPSMTGGYPQHGYQARPPTSWASPAPQMQQPGYGYTQPGAYPTQVPQYMSQPQYPGYPQQTSGGYPTGWDQTTGAPNQQTGQGAGYDYYSQQPQQQQGSGGSSGPADNTSYGYSQPPVSGYNPQGQSFPQGGYGGYAAPVPQPGYGQPQPNPQGYDQQQGYASYGNAANPTPEGLTAYAGAQGDSNQAPSNVQSSAAGQQGQSGTQQPSPNPGSYPPQGSAQPGYGIPTSQPGYGTQPPSGYGPNYAPPQGQKPAANQSVYAQPQQSPSAQGGYVQPTALQAGYPHSQPPPLQAGYAPPDSASQRPPLSGYGAPTVQPGYGTPPYGVAPLPQPGYGQQQQQLPPYNSSYGGGYSQSPAYSTDANAGGNAAPSSQSGQASGAAKASPQS
ncbi:uncharacterized protein LOC127812886 isoform X2 [Diospyros lotus]|uniref:uncharacterized protein LOC127812886 isoform X2 n=1 Tax=Diospyros lotus TaxID=55363 RepID=UPI0022558CCA|nr:uncharacterized protein LOC127812886 isoform X2 [Diospyros lotus]